MYDVTAGPNSSRKSRVRAGPDQGHSHPEAFSHTGYSFPRPRSGGDGDGETSSIVGGARGLFVYDAATRTVRRVATVSSQIPTTLTLAPVIAQLPNPNVLVPEAEPPPPVCSPFVTGS